jgi:hypothetical protein
MVNLIFDIDNTLVETQERAESEVNKAYSNLNFHYTEYHAKVPEQINTEQHDFMMMNYREPRFYEDLRPLVDAEYFKNLKDIFNINLVTSRPFDADMFLTTKIYCLKHFHTVPSFCCDEIGKAEFVISAAHSGFTVYFDDDPRVIAILNRYIERRDEYANNIQPFLVERNYNNKECETMPSIRIEELPIVISNNDTIWFRNNLDKYLHIIKCISKGW